MIVLDGLKNIPKKAITSEDAFWGNLKFSFLVYGVGPLTYMAFFYLFYLIQTNTLNFSYLKISDDVLAWKAEKRFLAVSCVSFCVVYVLLELFFAATAREGVEKGTQDRTTDLLSWTLYNRVFKKLKKLLLPDETVVAYTHGHVPSSPLEGAVTTLLFFSMVAILAKAWLYKLEGYTAIAAWKNYTLPLVIVLSGYKMFYRSTFFSPLVDTAFFVYFAGCAVLPPVRYLSGTLALVALSWAFLDFFLLFSKKPFYLAVLTSRRLLLFSCTRGWIGNRLRMELSHQVSAAVQETLSGAMVTFRDEAGQSPKILFPSLKEAAAFSDRMQGGATLKKKLFQPYFLPVFLYTLTSILFCWCFSQMAFESLLFATKALPHTAIGSEWTRGNPEPVYRDVSFLRSLLPDSSVVFALMGLADYERENYGEALASLQMAQILSGGQGYAGRNAFQTIPLVQKEKELMAMAKTIYVRQAYKKDIAFDEFKEWYAGKTIFEVRRDRSRYTYAIRHFEKALKINPDYTEAKVWLGKIKFARIMDRESY